MTTPKHRIMQSGPDLDKGLRELKEAGIKVLSFERVGKTIVYKCMADKQDPVTGNQQQTETEQ